MDVMTKTDFGPGPSLFRGGPFYRAQLATGLIKGGEWNNGRRVILAVTVAWVPLVLLTAFFNPTGLPSLLKSYRVYSRLFIAVPVLLFGQQFMELRFRMALKAIIGEQLLNDIDLKRMDEIIAFLVRLRDSFVPEAIVVALVLVHTVIVVRTEVDVTPWLTYGAAPDIHLTAAGWYAIIVSSTIFKLLLAISLWKWLLWTIVAFRFSRLDLKLIATHPDGHGGLGFFGRSPSHRFRLQRQPPSAHRGGTTSSRMVRN